MTITTKIIATRRAFLTVSLSLFCAWCLPAQAQNSVTITDTAVARTPIYNCNTDFSEHCKGIADQGNARLDCLQAHEKDLEHACKASMMAAIQQNKTDAMALNYAYESCQNERLSLCANIAAGDGKLLDCLKINEASVGETCLRALKNTGLWTPQANTPAMTTISTEVQ